MKKSIKIQFISRNDLPRKIIDFFKLYQFQLLEFNENILKFKNTGSLLDTWKSNPLNWGAEINILLSQNTLKANFDIKTSGQLKTYEEIKVWEIFINTFENYLTYGNSENEKLSSAIRDNTKSRYIYFSWSILGIFIGVLLALIYSKYINNSSILTWFFIPLFVNIILTQRIKYVKFKNVM